MMYIGVIAYAVGTVCAAWALSHTADLSGTLYIIKRFFLKD